MSKIFVAIILSISLGASVCGQSQKSKGKGGPLSIEGQVLPELTAFDESGAEVSLKKALKGRHGVIVFGCLT